MQRPSAGFTLVEILIVLAIIGILAAILFPAFLTARGKARTAACTSNLRQLGMAMEQYTADNDRYPRGLDPADRETPEIWSDVQSAQGLNFSELRLLPDVLDSYVKTRQIWRCPSDSGFDIQELADTPLDARPTCYSKFGMSYFYRTELTLLNLSQEHLAHPAETNVLSDGDGSWHGSVWGNAKRNTVLFADGHAKNISYDDYIKAWAVRLRE
ncbi:MAG TPA: prepilin-type N-terminal cleavage/methylation domain-containing protein [Abditibacteriaceae bacterium]